MSNFVDCCLNQILSICNFSLLNSFSYDYNRLQLYISIILLSVGSNEDNKWLAFFVLCSFNCGKGLTRDWLADSDIRFLFNLDGKLIKDLIQRSVALTILNTDVEGFTKPPLFLDAINVMDGFENLEYKWSISVVICFVHL